MTTTSPMPPKLGKAKAAAVTAAAMGITAALTLGGSTMAAEAVLTDRNDISISALPVEQRDVQLAAVAGLYGVGPIFWVANALGITPENVVMALVNQLDDPTITAAVQQLFTLLGAVVDIDAPGPLPSDVYNSVNGLEYTGNALLGLVPDGIKALSITPLGAALVNSIFHTQLNPTSTFGEAAQAIVNVTPILNQRRAIILSEGLGGLTTSLAYRDMIDAVTSNSDDWGPGVTAQWLIFIGNPSRPGGGLAALATPFTNLFGLNLSTPDGGSYTNAGANGGDITKVLNTSVLDITWAYNIWSDAPTTLNPLAWANALAGGFLLTYLIPDDLNFANTNLGSQLPTAVLALVNGAGVLIDPTGGQGLALVPGWDTLVDVAQFIDPVGVLGLVNALNALAAATKFPGKSFFITYDSGNLPILEPLDLLPRLLGIAGVNVPQPFVNSIEDALRMAINTGYQDVNPDLSRGYDQAGDQALIWHSALSPSNQVEAAQVISNALIDGIQNNLLNPEAWTPSINGQDGFNDAMKALIQNAVFMAVSNLANEGIDVLQALGNDGFDAVQGLVKPVLDLVDDLNSKVEGGIDSLMQVDKLTNPAPSAAPKPNVTPYENPQQTQVLMRTTEVNDEVSPLQFAADELGIDTNKDLTDGDASSIAGSLKQQRAALKADIDKSVSKLESSLDKRGKEAKEVTEKLAKGDIGGAAESVAKNVEKRVERLGKDVQNGVKKITGQDKKEAKKSDAA